VAAPANTSRWSPAYLKQVSQLLTQIDPLYYDSEMKTIATYQSWLTSSLAYYSANVAPGDENRARAAVYSANRWHIPAVENIETSTEAVSAALGTGSRRQRRRNLVGLGLSVRRGRRLRRQRRSCGVAVEHRRAAVLSLARSGLEDQLAARVPGLAELVRLATCDSENVAGDLHADLAASDEFDRSRRVLGARAHAEQLGAHAARGGLGLRRRAGDQHEHPALRARSAAAS